MSGEPKTGLTPEEQRKLISVEFVGGDKDGLVFRSDSSDPQEVQNCMGHYIFFSEGGRIGSGIRGMSEAGIRELHEIVENTPDGPRLKREPIYDRNHVYRVTDRLEDDQTIVVRYTYEGRESVSGSPEAE